MQTLTNTQPLTRHSHAYTAMRIVAVVASVVGLFWLLTRASKTDPYPSAKQFNDDLDELGASHVDLTQDTSLGQEVPGDGAPFGLDLT